MVSSTRTCFTRWLTSAFLVAVLILGFTRSLDRLAETPVEDSFDRALITFGVVRGINAIISVVQGTEVAIEPAGIGVILTTGEVFDPINDLIEQFSLIVLVACTSLGAQNILISFGMTMTAQLATLVAVFLLFALTWKTALFSLPWRRLVIRLSTIVLFIRFAVPVMVLANDAVYYAFLDEQYQTSYAVLEKTGEDVKDLQESENARQAPAEEGVLDQLGRWYDRTTQSFNIDARINEYTSRLSNASEHIVNLIVVFILQTLVFPLLFLWAGMLLLRGVTRDLF